MKSLISSLIGLVLSVSAGAEPLLEGRVRLESGEPVADAQVRIFDLSDLRREPVARAQTDGTGYFALPLAALTGSVLPTRFTLGQNYPNPFNPSTIIPYHLAALSEVRLEVFNLLGQHIATLVDGERSAGFHTATWHATDAAGRAVGAGVYVYRMTVGVESQTGRMVLIDGQAGVSAGGMASVWPGASGGSGSDGGDAQVYGLVVSGSGLTPYVDSAFRVEAGMAPVELVVSAGLPSAGKATDDDCAFCYLFNTQQEEGDDGQEAIPDAKLRAAIAAALGKASGATITKGEMETLRRLEANEAGISDLTGLEFATNLRELSLNGNEITDLSALAGLTKLEVLDLSGNQITDISALADLTKLWWLGLDGLSGNTITDIAALAGLTNLRVLYIGNNQITDVSALAGLTKLTHLYLWNNRITDVSALAGLTKLIELFLNDNPLSASSINDHIPILQARGVAVTFDPTPVTVTDDSTPVTIPDVNLRAAIEAALGKASGETITKGEMSTLVRLRAKDASISDLTGLEFATNLGDLRLYDNNLTDVSALAGLTKLEKLGLDGNGITDISALAGLTNLKELYLSGNQITDVSALARLTNLTELYLWNNQITDVSALAGLINLRNLHLRQNPLSASSINDHIPALQARGVAVTFDPTPSTVTDDPTPVTIIPDAKLRAAIAAALGKASDEAITKGEMETLTTLDAEDAGISNLAGLEFATNLGDLKLYDNNLTDVSALSGLTNLTVLRLGHNNITDVSALKELTKLTQLELDFNNVSDLSPLSGLTNLTVLGLGHNNITDVSALRGLTKLRSLGLWQNNITDVSALRGLVNLIWLELDYNSITDVSALKGLTKLKNLGLANNPLSASSINDHIPALQARGVTVAFDPIPVDPTPVTIPDVNLRAAIAAALDKASGATITKGEVETLLHLNAKDTGISDLTGLEFAANLKVLGLYGNRITDVSALAGLTNLTELHLSFNQITDVSALAGLTNLRILYLRNNQITDLSALAGLTKLRILDLTQNPLNASSINDHIPALQTRGVTVTFDPTPVTITDAPTPVTIPDASLRAAIEAALGKARGETITRGEMSILLRLDADDAGISDLTGLEFAINLIWLSLSDNQITDISALAGLTKLTELNLRQNPLNAASIDDHIPALQIRGITVTFDPPPVTIPDTNLRAAIAAALGKAKGETITKGEMSTLLRLDAENAGISDLTGLEFAINLTWLGLSDNNLTDISALARLTKLRVLRLDSNNLTDISALAGLTKLIWLNLSGNNLTDVSALAGLINLTWLGLSDNNLTDISALAGLTKLTELELRQNPLNASSIDDHIPALQARGITVAFDPTPETVTDDPTPVTIPDVNLRAAIAAALGKARGATITKGEMETLRRLEANEAGISDLTGLEFATNLTWLSLDGNQIKSISALAGLTNLEALGLSGNQITDLSALKGLTKLWWLGLDGLDGNQITDIAALAGLTNLRVLYIGHNQITDISALAGLTKLTHLYLWNNQITDISALASLTNLTELRLSFNQITDVSALAGLTNLRILGLRNNRITDVSALAGLTKLTELELRQNPLSASSINDHIPTLQTRGVTVEFDPVPATVTDDPTPVTIPDASLRAAIAAALGKASGATITKGEMSTLVRLRARNAGIRDLTGLEFAINLTWLDLSGNQITDLSALQDLTKLKELNLEANNISNLSALQDLTNLTRLTLRFNNISNLSALQDLTNLTGLTLQANNISNLSALQGLTNLTALNLSFNNISNLSALQGLTNLTALNLEFNNISNLSALQDLTNLRILHLRANPLSASTINNHIPALKNSGTTVSFDLFPFREGDFDIELVFLADFTQPQKRVIEYAARRWMSIIREDLPDYTFTRGFSNTCGDHSYRIPAGERIDDLRIYITSFYEYGGFRGWGGPDVLRETSHLSVVGCMGFNSDVNSVSWVTALHEIGHVLGVGTLWYNLGFLQNPSENNPNVDTHFNGPLAIAAFNDAGGWDYAGAKVPVQRQGGPSADSHWRDSVLDGELMTSGFGDRLSTITLLSAITLQSLADLGYNVDVTQAEPYTLPSAAAKASAKIAAPPTHVEPEWSCGTGQQQEPIYVVDPQGRIVRTISP